jgi:cyclophilin family peptidyl-prolyl cis-trans isomerase
MGNNMRKILFASLFLAFILGFAELNAQNFTKQEEQKMSDSTKQTNDSTIVAVLETSMGNIELELFPNEAPKTVENFTGLIEIGAYNGVIFHRVIDNFMIQGGDPTGTGRGGQSIWGGTFEDEFSKTLKFDGPGILAMANRGPNTNTSQFFITLVPTDWLNGKHTIFGKVIYGMDVVSNIGKVKTIPPAGRPEVDVVIKKASVEKRAK